MFRRAFGLAVAAALAVTLGGSAQPPKLTPEQTKAKNELKKLEEFLGIWNLEGSVKAGGKETIWKEQVDWSWKFRSVEPVIKLVFGEGKGKYFAGGELTYDVAAKKYKLALVATDKTTSVYTGDLKVGVLKVERKDDKGDVHRLAMNTLADGIRMQVRVEKQEGGKGLFQTAFKMEGNRSGESLAGGGKKAECIVTGGAASISVSFGGKQYFVCCSGCRDAFNETPQKFIDAAAKAGK
jgi:YHS domain-containing protein